MDWRIWREEQRHLPSFMRDFHDQKTLFKTIHKMINTDNNQYAKEVSWVHGHCYVVDVFLWFMAMHGYTLQRTRLKSDFFDIHTSIKCRDTDALVKQALQPPAGSP